VGEATVAIGLIDPRVIVLPPRTTHSKLEFEAHGPGLGSVIDGPDCMLEPRA